VARLRAILRRVKPHLMGDTSAPEVPEQVRSGALKMWPGRREARWGAATLELTGSEFSLLEALARQAGQLVSKQDLSLNALGRPLTRYDRRIDVHVSSIRQKLGPRADGSSWIQSVRGMGYMLIVE
jgi:two-component system OmpR family response regulator/two-component system response regulator CpxR